jgi:hypothetical protein
MDLVYRALGMVAAADQYLWRRRNNFVPLNLLLVGTAVALGWMALDDWRQAVRNGREPLVLPVSRLHNRPASATFVRVSGTLLPGGGFWYGERDDQGRLVKASMEFVPLVDAESGRGVLVQLNVPHRFREQQPDEITGMLREMRPFVSRELEPAGYRHNGISFLPEFVLVDGDDPGNPATAQITVVITSTIVLLFLVVNLKRHVFFRRGLDPDPTWHTAGGGGSVRATGTFHLGKHRKRFINVPAAPGTLGSGELALFANVDASSEFLGQVYRDRAGIWVLPIAAGSLQRVEQGTLYAGRHALPSVRFQYRDTISGRTRTAILSTPDGAIHELASALSGGVLGAWAPRDPSAQAPVDATADTHLHVQF